MPEPNLKGLVRASVITLPVGLALFIGGVVAIATKANAIGAVLLVLGIASVGVGCVLMLQVRNRARALSRDMQARQQANMNAAFRDYPN
jgi:membrane-bound ClpP family serine protease